MRASPVAACPAKQLDPRHGRVESLDHFGERPRLGRVLADRGGNDAVGLHALRRRRNFAACSDKQGLMHAAIPVSCAGAILLAPAILLVPDDVGVDNTFTGSSPRVRGTRDLARAGVSDCRFTPRMRGTPGPIKFEAQIIRFIPAHAGNTSERQRTPRAPPVHPRACGEHSLPPGDSAVEAGSSPRMRGTRAQAGAPDVRRRFIPAHAGNTLSDLAQGHRLSVHPRACGEH
jgi:hypothetical protein